MGRRKCPWTSFRRRKQRSKNIKMSKETKVGLAKSDEGSYYQNWSASSDSESDEPVGASRRKLESGENSGHLEIRNLESESSESESDSSEKSDTEESSTHSLNIIDGQLLQDALKECAICRDCKFGELELLKDENSRSGHGEVWILRCKRRDCKAHMHPTCFHTSPKNSRFYELNRAVVLAFRSIGRGYSAAQKFCSIINLQNPISSGPWSRHTKAILRAAETLLEEELNEAAFEVKKILRDVGDFEDCPDEELREKIVNAGASLDGSWSSRGWSSRDGIVAAISVESGKVVDVVYLSGSCRQCTRMEEQRNSGKMTRLEFLEWYLRHDKDCFMNHDGSAAVSSQLLLCYAYILCPLLFVGEKLLCVAANFPCDSRLEYVTPTPIQGYLKMLFVIFKLNRAV